MIDAAFDLVLEGKSPPNVDDVAARAGVSPSSVFRNFDGLADLQRESLRRFEPRFGHLIDVGDVGASRDERVAAHARSRVELCDRTGPLLRLARARAIDHDTMVEGLASIRARLIEQTRARFAPELGELSGQERADLLAAIDSITAPEAFDALVSSHARSPRRIEGIWVRTLTAVLDTTVPRSHSEVPDGAT